MKTTLFFLLLSAYLQAQNPWAVSNIDPELLKGADAIVRYDSSYVEIKSLDQMIHHKELVVTALTTDADGLLGFREYYQDGRGSIDNIDIRIFDKNGELIKKVDKDELENYSASAGSTIITTGRGYFYIYNPIDYPVTISYSFDEKSKNTVFIPDWYPMKSMDIAVERSVYLLNNKTDIEISTLTERMDSEHINSTDDNYFVASNLKAIVKEPYSPRNTQLLPKKSFKLAQFNYEGYDGSQETWENFANWIYNSLYKDRNDLDPATIREELSTLITPDMTKSQIVKALYEYVQESTRYISIQLNEGGWQPMKSQSVHDLKYGDCKALSYYMHSLLASFEIPSELVLVNASQTYQVSLHPEFSSGIQANHLILKIPMEEDTVWLDCTSHDSPFNYLGGFTDDRNVLCFSKNTGSLERTPAYESETDITDFITTEIVISDDYAIKGATSIRNRKMDYIFQKYLSKQPTKDRKDYIENLLSDVREKQVLKDEYIDDKEKGEIILSFDFSASQYGEKAGDYLLIPIAYLDLGVPVLKKDKKRVNPIEFVRSSAVQSKVTYQVPSGMRITETLEPFTMKSEFGEYRLDAKMVGSELQVERYFKLNKAQYEPEKYNDIRNFFNRIRKKEKDSLALTKRS